MMEWNLSCITEARSMTLMVTALAILLAEGRTVDEIALLANLLSGVSAQLDILASYDCRKDTEPKTPPTAR